MGSGGLRAVPHAPPLLALRGQGSATRARSLCPGQEGVGEGLEGVEGGEDRGTPRRVWPRPSWPSSSWRHLVSSGRTLSDALSGSMATSPMQSQLFRCEGTGRGAVDILLLLFDAVAVRGHRGRVVGVATFALAPSALALPTIPSAADAHDDRRSVLAAMRSNKSIEAVLRRIDAKRKLT